MLSAVEASEQITLRRSVAVRVLNHFFLFVHHTHLTQFSGCPAAGNAVRTPIFNLVNGMKTCCVFVSRFIFFFCSRYIFKYLAIKIPPILRCGAISDVFLILPGSGSLFNLSR